MKLLRASSSCPSLLPSFETTPKRPPKPRGPEPGKNRRYAAADAKLFPELERLMREEGMSFWGAALNLAQNGKVAGENTKPESQAKRLMDFYKEKHPEFQRVSASRTR
jgi:hypothetical protein